MEWRHSGNKDKGKNLLERGFCPVCEIRVLSQYHAPCTFINSPEYEEWLQLQKGNGQ